MRAGHYNDIVLRTRRPDSQRRKVLKGETSFQMTPGEMYSPDREDSGSRAHRLIVVESEGAVFDIPAPRVESAYIPAFMEHFGFASDPATCADIWRFVALKSKLRGSGAFRCLAASLRLANRRCPPSVRRSVVAGTLESWLAGSGDHLLRSELAFRTDPVLGPAWEWYRSVEYLIDLMPPPLAFPAVARTLSSLAPGATVLAVSSEAEADALSMWRTAGLLPLCSSLAGRETGDLAVCLARACAGGYGSVSVTVIGSSYPALAASRMVEARFLPIVPGRENESWLAIGESEAYCEGARGGKILSDASSKGFRESVKTHRHDDDGHAVCRSIIASGDSLFSAFLGSVGVRVLR